MSERQYRVQWTNDGEQHEQLCMDEAQRDRVVGTLEQMQEIKGSSVTDIRLTFREMGEWQEG